MTLATTGVEKPSASEFGGLRMPPSIANVTTARTTRMTAAPTRPADLEARVAADLRGDGALAGAELDERVEQRALDADEDRRRRRRGRSCRACRCRRRSASRRTPASGSRRRRRSASASTPSEGRREGEGEDAAAGAGVGCRPRRRGILFMRRHLLRRRLARGVSSPWNSGSRFSRNAATPSAKSPDAAISCWIAASSSSCSLQSRVQPGVELALGAGVGPRRPAGEAVERARRPPRRTRRRAGPR